MREGAEASCKWILDHIPADADFKVMFGPRTDPNVEVQLPWVVTSRQYLVTQTHRLTLNLALADHRCALTMRTAGPSDLAYWGTLWESAVELASICARHGMQGRKVQLGRLYALRQYWGQC